MMTAEADAAAVLPALELLPIPVRLTALDPAHLTLADGADGVLLDARADLAQARALSRLLGVDGMGVPVLAVVSEGSMSLIGPDWGVRDLVLASAGPVELAARIRLLPGHPTGDPGRGLISVGDLIIEEDTYTARFRGRPLELTYKEFELLKFLASHPGRVFTREQLVTEVWGYDFFGGTRTVDVHVRRLRAKLGSEHEALIGTVRNVGYKMVPQRTASTS